MQKEGYQCKCAKTWQLKNISQVIIANIAIQLVNAITAFFLIGTNQASMAFKMLALVSVFGFGFQIYYLYLMISYINQLKNTNCSCVDDKFTRVMTYYAWTKVTFFAVMILGGVILAAALSMMKLTSPK